MQVKAGLDVMVVPPESYAETLEKTASLPLRQSSQLMDAEQCRESTLGISSVAVMHQLQLLRHTSSSQPPRSFTPQPPPLLLVTSSLSLRSLLVGRSSSIGRKSSTDNGQGIEDVSTVSDNEWPGPDEVEQIIEDGLSSSDEGDSRHQACAEGQEELYKRSPDIATAQYRSSSDTLSVGNTGSVLSSTFPQKRILRISVGEQSNHEGQVEFQPENENVPDMHQRQSSLPAHGGPIAYRPSTSALGRMSSRDEPVDSRFMQQASEAEDDDGIGREASLHYSSVEGNFDLGGFRIGERGLVSSPRNRQRLRPSLNDGDNFIVLARLGSGNSSTVHKALHLPSCRLVALKTFQLYSAERRSQVLRELRVLYENLASIDEVRTPVENPSQQQQKKSQRKLWVGKDQGQISDCPQHAIPQEASLDYTSEIERRAGRCRAQQTTSAMAGDEEDGLTELFAAVYTGPSESDEAVHDRSRGAEDTEKEDCGPCPFIVSFYDGFADPRRACLTLVLEYMDGGSLQDIVDRGGCSDEALLADISFTVLMGLKYLHERRKIHRDIKPSNMLINSSGQVKIADFGTSATLGGTDDLTHTFMGTLGFMSPERIQGGTLTQMTHEVLYSMAARPHTLCPQKRQGAVDTGDLSPQVSGEAQQSPPTHRVDDFPLDCPVCDSPAPDLPEDRFSNNFRDFIAQSLAKDPRQRPSSLSLLSHPFLAGRHSLTPHVSRAELPISHDVKVAELQMICQAIILHLASRSGREGEMVLTDESEDAAEILPALSLSERGLDESCIPASDDVQQEATLWADAGQVSKHQRSLACQSTTPLLPARFLDHRDMISRLANELGLKEALVSDKLETELQKLPGLLVVSSLERSESGRQACGPFPQVAAV